MDAENICGACAVKFIGVTHAQRSAGNNKMKLLKDCPHRLKETKDIFATRPKCPSLICGCEKKGTFPFLISYYALGQHYKCSKVSLFSIDEHFMVVGDEFFSTVEQAMC